MKLIFMGTPDFAVPCLRALIEAGHEVAAVFTQPDKPKGRKQTLTAPPVKELALQNAIPVYQNKTLRDGEALSIMTNLRPDAIVVVAYGKILPPAVLAVPRLGCVNVHASVLPKYRGAAPIQWAVINGERETGVTTMLMDEGVDTGDILLCEKTPVAPDETSGELFLRLSAMGAPLLCKTLTLLEQGVLSPVKQDNAQATFAPVLDKTVCELDWSRPALELHNQIRGLNPWPVAQTVINGKRTKLYRSRLREGKAAPGEVICDKNTLSVACKDGSLLELLELQPEGKPRMSAAAFLNGTRESVTVGTL